MVTYPSTHGVFEESIKEICQIIHDNGGLVYMDGANMNAQVGLTSSWLYRSGCLSPEPAQNFRYTSWRWRTGHGADLCKRKIEDSFLPGSLDRYCRHSGTGAVSAARYGSASILLISYAYIKMLGRTGIRQATDYAILNANYMKTRLETYYQILYTRYQ